MVFGVLGLLPFAVCFCSGGYAQNKNLHHFKEGLGNLNTAWRCGSTWLRDHGEAEYTEAHSTSSTASEARTWRSGRSTETRDARSLPALIEVSLQDADQLQIRDCASAPN